MAFWFGDGFDLYTAVADAATYWDASLGGTVSLALSASGRFAGSRGITVAATGSATVPYVTKTSGANDAVHHISLSINNVTALSGTNVCFWVTFYDGATAQCSVGFRSDGAILLTSGAANGTTLATYTGALAAANTWYQFEIEVVINNTTGSIAVRKLGNTSNDFFLGSLNTRASTNNYANKIGAGVNVTAPAQVVDDFLWRSDASSLSWLGDIRCYTRMPASDASVAWSRSGTSVPITPFAFSANINTTTTTARFTPFIATVGGSVGTLVLQLGAADTGNIKCSLFADNGSNAPGAVLGSATPLNNAPSGNNTFTFSSPVSVTVGTKYWAGFMTDTVVTSGWANGVGSTSVTQTGTTYAAFPTANPGVTTSQSPLVCTINVGVSANFSMVQEAQQDAANSYVYSSTVGQSDLYGLASLSATPGSIIGVTTRAYMEKSDAGTRIAAVQLQSGASNVQGSLTLNTTWGWAARNDLVDPATGAAWTATGVNNAQIGVTVTT